MNVRDYIMKLLLHELYPKTPFTYLGTFFVKQGDTDSNDLIIRDTGESLKSAFEKTISSSVVMDYMFTICLVYEENKVHFVSFVYETTPPRLVSFDSGSELYLVGERVIVPILRKIFENSGLIPSTQKAKHHIGICKKRYFFKKYGIQFSGENPLYRTLPADAFCQSWSLFFLVEWVRHHHKTRTNYSTTGKSMNGGFVRQWCKIQPTEREWFLISHFFIPLLSYNPYLHKEFETFYPKTHICRLMDYMLDEKWHHVPSIKSIKSIKSKSPK